MSRELDEACARAMGWNPYHTDGVDYYRLPSPALMPANEFEPSTDPIAARLLEDEIDRRGLGEVYIRKLERAMSMSAIGLISDFRAFQLLRATPEQRARAFLETMGAHDESRA